MGRKTISELMMNEVLLISASAWALAQLIKVILGRIREKHIDWHYFVASGRMPSAHSATTTALATATAWTQGLSSVAFAISAVVALIVMYDATGVRRAVSRQSVILNRIIRELHENRPRDEVERNLREFIGHTPTQVFVGAALGMVVAFVWIALSSL
ncbi:MAG: divergent PAP2 family protein [Chloroflexi bacterium]|nr:divergent PAP2 family protein [Chloroflexota bacterium]